MEPCLSDRETAGLLGALGDALDAANGQLLKLKDWFVAAGAEPQD